MQKIIINNHPLEEEQLKPILDNPKYAIIVAGAGSGKSITLVGKVKYLLNGGITPESILCITFTNEAVLHLKDTLKENTGLNIPTTTFHKLALELLKKKNETYQIAYSDTLDMVIDEFFSSFCFGNQSLQNIIFSYFYIYFFRTEKSYQALLKTKEFMLLKKLIHTFIALYKNNAGDSKKWQDILKRKKSKRQQKILLLIYAIYLNYESELESAHKIDFDDMIKEATKMLQEKPYSLPYQYILIDEFQDTSENRFNFILEILKQTNASLWVVGDDYQSIYHFTGCDLSLFLNFTKKFPNAHLYKLEHTYRNSQELVSIATQFIMKNPYQLPKKMVSETHIEKPITLVYYHHSKNVIPFLLKHIDPMNQIFILGRNSFDLNDYLFPYQLDHQNRLHIQDFSHQITYLTIHKAKGLERDIVILLNVSDTLHGLPTKIKDETLLKYVKNSLLYPFEEERRLFYVALTRAKKEVYLCIPINHPSPFIKELKHHKQVKNIWIP